MDPEPRIDLAALGWNDAGELAFAAVSVPGWEPARVVAEFRGAYRVHAAGCELRAEPSGRLRLECESGGLRPVVGDWVAVEARPAEGSATVHTVLPRRSSISRRAAGRRTAEQVLAANLDVLFVATALDADFDLRRLERYLAVAWDGGVLPVVLLTKSDLCADVAAHLEAARAVAPGVPVHALCPLSGSGLDAVRAHLGPGRTAALVGSSGVGKTTLVNALLGAERLATGAVRPSDSRGRHVTSVRQLLLLPAGGAIIDTPGLRELALWDEDGLERAFADIETLAGGCRFPDCRHDVEPGCAVRAAIAAGALPAERLAGRRKLERELEHLDAKRNAALRAERSRRDRLLHRAYNRMPKRDRGGS